MVNRSNRSFLEQPLIWTYIGRREQESLRSMAREFLHWAGSSVAGHYFGNGAFLVLLQCG